ncbi:lipid II:glycine glycyltransferase (peptidoglycan interpeptide bridge formation enzyme) [Thermosporothrix hazakensis]|jgi:lipid II:glycine glycyltransferase (peptidoglycan interpeptide bridge formation enzyme)|uniref:Lipid II:glycine glycyltransferase (Peptidoglycan interpeptide bridge formation enzyme) n=2 Tax=Thermosporothrix TaxID=768650 RepID=A0A326UIW0_THEHA|nr:peptidoglycan bridge formation glycyltransferase FemA/FemB family protein [Thermosporothrix hazakensis]PZW36670.1 lipid II:glycine glycyltransferase (peptidoglycan interpeptide bridge formation enzyme) [Thermosporothrix hazakensis]BBH89138.1 hypothetical protein KTC_38890 [Thermosporothrix sp. COM3]GCE47321.1 hypothetical protein KTH_21900 [Thermosporothrix hazakensis]
MQALHQRYTLHLLHEAAREVWNRFVDEHPNGHFLQSWEWGELKAPTGWLPQRLVLWDREQLRIVAGAQVLCRTAPHVPLRMGHLAYIPKGPVLDWRQPELWEPFFTRLHEHLKRQGAVALQVESAEETETEGGRWVAEWYRRWQMQPLHPVQPLRSIVLDLSPAEEALLAGMKEKWRYNVRLAARRGVTIRVAERPADVRAWYNLYRVTSERDHFGIHDLEYYLRVWQLFAPQNRLRLLLAEHEGQLLAGIFVGLFARQGIYLYGASGNEKRQLMPNYLLQWEAVRWCKQQGATTYDFWGIPDTDAEGEAMAGVYRFKRGWGGRVVQYIGSYQHVYQPWLMRLAERFL